MQLEKQMHTCINREVKEILSLELCDRIWDRIIMSMKVAGWPEFGLTPKPGVYTLFHQSQNGVISKFAPLT